jgi:hypothetical protein
MGAFHFGWNSALKSGFGENNVTLSPQVRWRSFGCRLRMTGVACCVERPTPVILNEVKDPPTALR